MVVVVGGTVVVVDSAVVVVVAEVVVVSSVVVSVGSEVVEAEGAVDSEFVGKVVEEGARVVDGVCVPLARKVPLKDMRLQPVGSGVAIVGDAACRCLA